MAFCKDCGTELTQEAEFCPQCGAQVSGAQTPPPAQEGFSAQQATDKVTEAFNKFNNTADSTAEYDPADIQQNKVMAILSYFGLLALIPLFAAQNSKFARFHAKQGINLLLLGIVYGIVSGILNMFKTKTVDYVYGIPVEYSHTPWFISLILWLLGLCITALAIIGIVNAVKGRAKDLPIIGKIKIIK